ncbi:MAG: adenylate/guanylate cyclase domain-containing protein [Cyanobacteria bacterium P01_E01_bin.42]
MNRMKPPKINPKQFNNYSKQELAHYIEVLEQELEEANEKNTELELLSETITELTTGLENELHEKNTELELLLETVTELTTGLENELHQRNKEMKNYIKQVELVTKAAVAVENDTFQSQCLDDVAERDDSLGTLARVFQNMAKNLKNREKQLADAKEQLEVVLNAVPGPISWIDANGFYIGVNQHLAQTLKVSPDNFVGNRLDFLENSPEFSNFINGFINSSQNSVSKEVVISIEDEKRYYLMVAQKYNRGNALVSVGIDITQRRKAQQALETERNSFARFVPAEYLQFLGRESIVNIQLGDHIRRESAILFSDIRSFTSLAETMNPQEIFNFVNSYLGRVSPAIRDRNGFIMKYIGDSIMAAFPEGATDAVNAGIDHLHRVKEYNQRRKKSGYIPIKIGIGIHIGRIMVGIIGEPQRLQGDALSDSVNLASRLEGLTKIYGASILISDSVLAQLENRDRYQIRFLDRVTVKGRKNSIDLYEVLNGTDARIIDLKLKTQADFQQAIALYQQGKWMTARAYFQKVLNVNDTDRAALLYQERIKELIPQVRPDKWDGIWHFTQK